MNLSKDLNATIVELNEVYNEGSFVDYINDALEVEYAMSLSGGLQGVELLVSSGGPNVFINTRTAKIELYANGEHLEHELQDVVLEAIEQAFTEMI